MSQKLFSPLPPLVFLLVFCFLFPGSIKGETLTLVDLINFALENNYEVQNALLDKEEARALIGQAEAGRGFHSELIFDIDRQKTPSSLETLYSIAGEEVGASYSTYSGTIALSTVVRDTLDTSAPVQKARLAKKEAMNSLQQARYSTTEETLESVFNVFRARNGITLAEKALENRKSTLERTKREKDEGIAVSSDVQEAELEVEEARRTLESSRRLLELAQENLSRITGIEKEEIDNILSPSLPDLKEIEKANPWPWDLEQMQKLALDNRPELQSSQLGIDLAEIELKEAKSNRFDFSLGASFMSPENNVGLGLEMSSDFRVTGTFTHFDTTLPQVDGIEIDDDDWEDFVEAWPWETPPEWFPEKKDMEELLSFETEQENEWQIEARVSFNLFDSHLRNSRIKEKETALKRAENIQEEALKGVKLEIKGLLSDLEDAFATVNQASLAYDFARQRYRETEIMVEQGVATTAEKELAALGKERAKNDLLNYFFEYERKKVNLGAAMGLEIDLFLATLEIK